MASLFPILYQDLIILNLVQTQSKEYLPSLFTLIIRQKNVVAGEEMSTWWNQVVMQVMISAHGVAHGVMFFGGTIFLLHTRVGVFFKDLKISEEIPADVPEDHLQNIRT